MKFLMKGTATVATKPSSRLRSVGAILAATCVMVGATHASQAEAAEGKVQFNQFRNIFAGALGSGYTEQDVKKLIYAPSNEILYPPKGDFHDGASFLRAAQQAVARLEPVNLQKLGAAIPLNPMSATEIETVLKSTGSNMNDRPTIVVVPGIFGEFIDCRSFEEVLSRQTAYKSHWESALKVDSDPKHHLDMAYSLADYNYRLYDIKDLISVGSVDDKSGKPLVNLVLLNTKKLSLESLGDVGDKAETFNRRLNKFFAIMGVPKNITVLGYSRGAVVGLDMMARANAHPTANPWIKSVHAMVALGGVTYGSDLADLATNSTGAAQAPASARQLIALEKFGNGLTLIPPDAGSIKKAELVAKNLEAWAAFGADMIKAGASEIGTKIKHASKQWAINKRLIADGFRIDLNGPVSLVVQVFFDTLQFDNPSKDYNLNVLKGKKLIEAVVTGAKQLSEVERLKWWGRTVIPTEGIRYYSVAGTMVDPQDGAPEAAELSSFPKSYNAQLLDYPMLVNNYRGMKGASGVKINDSQVSVNQLRFWPEIATKLNPAQKPMDHTFLALLGTDHWNLAIRQVNVAREGALANPYNPFPREALIKSIATAIVIDSSHHQ